MLREFKALDLTTEMGWLCGKILGDLGADVIKIEPPEGILDVTEGRVTGRHGTLRRVSSGLR